jgi:hypothetical protein
MKISYFIALLVFVLGIFLVSWGMSEAAEVTLLGVAFHPRIAKGAGVILAIFGLIAFLAAWGSSLPPSHAGRRG